MIESLENDAEIFRKISLDYLDYIHKLNDVNRRYDELSREASYMRKQLKDREDVIKQQAETIDTLIEGDLLLQKLGARLYIIMTECIGFSVCPYL